MSRLPRNWVAENEVEQAVPIKVHGSEMGDPRWPVNRLADRVGCEQTAFFRGWFGGDGHRRGAPAFTAAGQEEWYDDQGDSPTCQPQAFATR